MESAKTLPIHLSDRIRDPSGLPIPLPGNNPNPNPIELRVQVHQMLLTLLFMLLTLLFEAACVRFFTAVLKIVEVCINLLSQNSWKATFIIGYGLPLQDFLFESPDGRRYLNFTFGCPLVETVVDKLTLKVVLPEGSKDPSAVVPFSVEQHLETKYSYLDIVGRTVVVLEKKNVVPEHNSPFQVYYTFNPVFMLAEPLMLISVFFFIFMSSVAYLHVDFSISK